jgi:uncharacterized protein YkwD
MDADRFGRIARGLAAGASRRRLLGGAVALLGAGGEEAAAHDAGASCRRIGDPRKRTACLAKARRHARGHAAPPAPCRPTDDAAALELLGLVNAWRAEHGARPLVLDGVLLVAARTKSAAMARAGVLDHEIGGVDATENRADHGYPMDPDAWGADLAFGENIALGHPTAARVFEAWKASRGHNKNMLDPAFRAMGVGLARGDAPPRPPDADIAPLYWTQTFGSAVVEQASGC